MDDVKAQIEGVQKDIKVYSALKNINKSDELDAFMDLLVKTASEKMLMAFTTETIKDFSSFMKLKGEIASYLYPVQEVRGAKAMEETLTNQLKEYYKNPYKD